MSLGDAIAYRYSHYFVQARNAATLERGCVLLQWFKEKAKDTNGASKR